MRRCSICRRAGVDEPTAALDARAEYEVFQRFAELTSGRTAVLISHRFSTVRMADRILVLEAKDEWWKGTCNGKTGIFPANYVQKAEASVPVVSAGGMLFFG